jgi:hypothetical protein
MCRFWTVLFIVNYYCYLLLIDLLIVWAGVGLVAAVVVFVRGRHSAVRCGL